MSVYPVVIIGAGPAGLAAAMQLSRQGHSPLVFEQNRVGGLLVNANWVENYPGFVEGITGPELVRLFEDQARRLGVNIIHEQVISVQYEGGKFRIATSHRDLKSGLLVAASGTTPRKYQQDVLSNDLEGKVFAEVFPLNQEKNKTIVIIGAGDAAFDFGINLSRHNKVIILNRGSQIKALPLLWDRIQKINSIHYQQDAEIIEASNTPGDQVSIKVRNSKGTTTIVCDYIITAIGRDPAFDFAGQSIMEQKKQLLKDQKLFLIGDLQNGSFRQTSIAVGDGVRTAMIIGQILEKG